MNQYQNPEILSATNELGQPIGLPLPDWQPRQPPPKAEMSGRYCRLVPVDASAHAADLFAAFSRDETHRNWTYLPYGPFASSTEVEQWLAETCLGDDPLFHTIFNLETGSAVGVASYLRIEPGTGVIETGHIHYSPLLQRTPLATETMYLMMQRVFDELGYRRYEWKCDALNAPSRSAALRLGFSFEGIFRQATIYSGRNRDTAWFSILDHEWPRAKRAFEQWLEPSNFDADGVQRQSLAPLRESLPT